MHKRSKRRIFKRSELKLLKRVVIAEYFTSQNKDQDFLVKA